MKRRGSLTMVTLAVGAASFVVATAVPAAANTPSGSAGYAASSTSPIKIATWQFTIPTVTCPATGTHLFNIEGDVGGSGDNATSVSTVNCTNGKVGFGSEVELINSAGFVGKYITGVTAGDTISTTFTMAATGMAKLVAKDVTNSYRGFIYD